MSSRGNEIGRKYYKGFNVAFFFLDFLLFDRRYDYFIFVFFFFYEAVILKQRWIEKNISYDEDYFLSIFFFKYNFTWCFLYDTIGSDYVKYYGEIFFHTTFLNYESF